MFLQANARTLDFYLQMADFLGEIGHKQGQTPGEVALASTLRQPAVTGTTVGV